MENKRSKSNRLIKKYIQLRNLNDGLLDSRTTDFQPNFEVPGLFPKQTLNESFQLFQKLVY